MEIRIKRVVKDGILRHIYGKVNLMGIGLEFEGVSWEDQIGGPNVHARFTDSSREKLIKMGYDEKKIDELETSLQLRILHGEIIIETNKIEEFEKKEDEG